MNEERAMQIFFEIHRDLPREGPGDGQCTRKALSMAGKLPDKPRIIDIGCGPGMQTLDLASATDGVITAVDNWQPFLDQLEKKAAQEGLQDQIKTVNADMAALDFEDASFDLVWSEGAAYIMGFQNALHSWKRLLKKPGCLVVSEIAWLRDNPPEEVREYFAAEYPAMRDIESNLDLIRGAG
ncbi:MAG: class I SAM-dependent methyltransferase, partial [Dehalococcoidia bacterium]|nr:class I SAM-dependent methyltransferase [Dehalococcoidia bacterium]